MAAALRNLAFRLKKRAWDREEAGLFEEAEIQDFDGIGRLFWFGTKPQSHPPIIEAIANTRGLAETDMPYTDQAWPIISRRMLDALVDVAPFPHKTVPVHFRPRRQGDPDLPHAYVVLQVLTHLDAFDREQSDFEPSQIDPKRANLIRRLVLSRPPGGFPPCFRIPEDRTLLFVSGEAKQALERIGIKGVDFFRVDVSGG